MKHLFVFIAITLCYLLNVTVNAQKTDTTIVISSIPFEKISKRSLDKIDRSFTSLEDKLVRSTEKTLKRFQKQELKLQKKIFSKDSIAALNLFNNTQTKYANYLQKLASPLNKISNTGVLKEYIPKIDSVNSAMQFLNKAGASNLPLDKIQGLQNLSKTINGFQAQLNTASDIKQFLKTRKQELKTHLEQLGMLKELKQMNKEFYYYQQQFKEYKEMLNDPDKMTNKLLSIVKDLPAFKDFMSKNSQLAQLFRVPGSGSATGTASVIPGLQTRASVQQQVSQLLGTNPGTDPTQYIQQQAQQAQSEVEGLRQKLNQLGGGNSDLEMPNFKPNTQKTKSIWKRLEYGLNIQSQRPNGLLPVTTDIGVTIGYKINDKSIVGFGGSYKMGWGKDINHIIISNQGIGLRSYVDIKLKKSIWITGGYEQNYMKGFDKIPQLDDYSKWQQSGLLGLSKKYKIGKKAGNMQLLWDFLSYRQIPQTQPLKFRIGYQL